MGERLQPGVVIPAKRASTTGETGPSPWHAVEVTLEYHFMRTELVTILRRQVTELLSDIERDKTPILITRHSLPKAYLLNVESYLLKQQRMTVLEGIARGEQAVAEGRWRLATHQAVSSIAGLRSEAYVCPRCQRSRGIR